MEYLQTKVLDGMMKELLEEFEPMHVLDQLVQKNIVDTEGEQQIKARKSRKERVMTTVSNLQPKHCDDRWLLRFAELLEVSAWYGTLGEKLKKETDCAMKEVKDIQELYSVSEESFIRLSHLLQIATAIQESDARKLLEYFQVPNTNSNDLGKTLVKFLLSHKIPIILLKEACSKFNLKYLKDINAKHDTILSFPELQGNFLVKLPASRSHKKVSLLESGTLWESSPFPKETSIKLYVFFRGEYDIHFVKLYDKAKSLRLRIESKRTLDKLLEENEAGVFGTNMVKLLYKSINDSASTPNIRLDFSKSKLENVIKKLPTVGDTSSLSSCSSLASFEAGYSEEQSTFDYLDMMDRLIQAINISDIKVLCAYLKINRVDNILGSENPRRKFIHVCRQSKIWTSKDTSRLVEAVRSNKLTNLENIVTGKKNDMSLWPEVTVNITPTKPYNTTFTKFKQFMLRRKGVAKSKVEKEVGVNLLFKVSTESLDKLKTDIDSGRFLQELLRIYKDETGDLMTSKAERKSIKLAYDENQFKELLQHVANEEKSRQHTFEYLDMMDRLIETMDISDIDLLCKYFNMDTKTLERIQGSINPKREFLHVCRRKKIWTSGNTLHLLEAVRSTQLTRLQGIIEDFNDMSLCPEVTLMMKSNSSSGAFAELEEFLLSRKKRLDTEFRREFKVHLVDCEKGSIIFRLKVPSKDSLDQLIGDIHSGRLLKILMTIYNEHTKKEAPILEDGKLSIKLSYDTLEVKDASDVLKQPTFSIKDQWKRALMRVQTLMEEDFDPFSLMEIFTSNGTLTSTEVDALKATAKRKQRVRLFISFLETKEETAFNSFRFALEGCSYYEVLAKALNSEVKGSPTGYHLSGVTEDMTEGSQVSDKTDEISQQCSTEEVDFDIFLDSCGKWNIERAPTKRFVEEEQMVATASKLQHFKTTKVLAEKGDIYSRTTSNVGNENKDMNDPGDIVMHVQEREKTIATEKWKKLEEKFYNPSFFCEHDSIHQYQDISKDINVLLIGKCGAGKSATGNTILGKDIFEESDTDAPETKSVKFETIKEGKFNITVVDTPGIQNDELLLNVVEKMIAFGGDIHLCLVVCGDKTDQETTKVISRILFETACDQSVVVLTNARARFGGKKKMSGYIDRQKDGKGPLADLCQRVGNRIIAVENCFDEEDVMIIQRQKFLCCLAQVIKDNKGLAFTKESFQNAKTWIKQYQDMEVRLHEFLLQTYLKNLSQQELNNIQTTLNDNVKDIMQACKVLELFPLITEGDAMQYMRLFIQENEKELSKIQADGKRLNEIWKALEEKFYCIKCDHDNIGDYEGVPKEINILLIGKTGSGKSATGNTIIGGKHSFRESGSSASVTKTIDKKEIHESGFHITVIDTPGLFDTAKDFKNKDKLLEIAKTMINFQGGIHLFLLVVSSTSRFTKEEQDTISDIEKILGTDVYKNCILVLTYARAKFGSDNSLQDYVKQETKDNGKFGNLLKHVNNRIIAVENVFDEDFLTEKHRQKLLSCFAHIIHKNKGSVYSNNAFKNAKARVERQEKERKNRVAREAELTHMKNILRKFLSDEYLEHLTEKELNNIHSKVRIETLLIMSRSGVKQLPLITKEDVKTYVETFIRENGVIISKLKDVKIQEAEQLKEYEDTKRRLKYEEDINKMQSIVLPLVSNYLKQQSKQKLEKIIRLKQPPADLTDKIIAALESNDVDVELKQIESYFQEYFENPTQIQGYIDDKVLTEKLEEKSKKVQREQRLNEIMGTLETNLNKHLESKDCEALKKLRTDLEGKEHSGPGNWVSILTELVGSQIKGSGKTIIEVTNLFLKQNNDWIQGILEILLDKRQKQQEAKLLKEMEELRNSAFSIISREIREKLKSYLIGKSTSELLKLEKQISNNEVPKDVFNKIIEQLTSAQKQSLSPKDINDEILKQIKEQSKVIEECKKDIGVCFVGSSEVRIKERGIDKISNVRVNDEILVFDEFNNVFYDKVYLISHAREDENITFVRLQTSSDKDLRISPGHILPVGCLGSNVAAKDVTIGNVIFTLQDGVMMPDKVTSVTYELCRGAYCPMTMHGTIVVNDVAASCYTTFFPSPLAHALLSPIRLLFSYLPLPLFNKLLPYDIEEGMPVLLLKCRSIVNMWRSLFTRNDKPIKSV